MHRSMFYASPNLGLTRIKIYPSLLSAEAGCYIYIYIYICVSGPRPCGPLPPHAYMHVKSCTCALVARPLKRTDPWLNRHTYTYIRTYVQSCTCALVARPLKRTGRVCFPMHACMHVCTYVRTCVYTYMYDRNKNSLPWTVPAYTYLTTPNSITVYGSRQVVPRSNRAASAGVSLEDSRLAITQVILTRA